MDVGSKVPCSLKARIETAAISGATGNDMKGGDY